MPVKPFRSWPRLMAYAGDLYQDSKPAAIQEAVEQRAAQSPSENSETAIKASPVLGRDAKLTATAGTNERAAIANWRDNHVIRKQAEDGLEPRDFWICDMFSAILGLAC